MAPKNLRHIYAQKGLAGIPRLLSLMDRNDFSPTYGCMDREYWLCRTTDFPSSIAQFGVHALALAYAHEMPDNPYYRQPVIKDWIMAGLDYWTKIQKSDGSFDEFYPNERGWAGPTGFLVYALTNAYRLIGGSEAVPSSFDARFRLTVRRAGLFLADRDEHGVLANHHAMAVLPIYEAYDLLGDAELLAGFKVRLDHFLSFCHDEGWCLEYDGADLGYLSATVSFLSKLRLRGYTDERVERVIERAVEFSSHFAYPDGHYAGSLGSRQTLHFYPHGYELLAGLKEEISPLAATVAQRMVRGLAEGRLVPPEIMEDRYFVYRVPEMLLSYVDYGGRPAKLPALPYQQQDYRRYWPGAKMAVDRSEGHYLCANLARGGVIKLFDVKKEKCVLSDAGLVGVLDDGRPFTSQWIDEGYQVCTEMEQELQLQVAGDTHFVPTKLFDPLKMMVFRTGMLALGWHARLAHEIKGGIRQVLMTAAKPAPLRFVRTIRRTADELIVVDTVKMAQSAEVARLRVGGDFSARYVPQSRYFQLHELDAPSHEVPTKHLQRLNTNGTLTVKRTLSLADGTLTVLFD
jgi:hypothetical protein